MKHTIAITGSRSIQSKELVYFILKLAIRQFDLNPAIVKSGGARGFDSLAEEFFREFYGIEPQVIRPDYRTHPPNIAPLVRNEQIISGVDCVIAVWSGEEVDGKKGGTRYTADKAAAKHIPVIFVNVKRGIMNLVQKSE